MATLTFERGAAGGSGEAMSASAEQFGKLVALAKQRGADDPVLGDALAQLAIEVAGARFSERRARVPGLVSERPMAIPMMSKLLRSELDQRMARLGCEYLGTLGRLAAEDADAPNGGDWPRGYMNSFGFTIGGGTSEIQRNLLAERVLGLPRSR